MGCPRERRAAEEDNRDADSVLDPDHPARRGCVCLVGWIPQCGGSECGRALGGALGGAVGGAIGGALRCAVGGSSLARPIRSVPRRNAEAAVDQVTTALPQFAEAFAAAAAADATDTEKIAFGTAAFKLRVALESGTAILAVPVEGLPECGVEAQTQAQGFFATLTEDSQDLLGRRRRTRIRPTR